MAVTRYANADCISVQSVVWLLAPLTLKTSCHASSFHKNLARPMKRDILMSYQYVRPCKNKINHCNTGLRFLSMYMVMQYSIIFPAYSK